MAAYLSSHDYLRGDAVAESALTEVLNDEVVQLVSSAQLVSEGADDPETAEASTPTPGQETNATDLPRRFARAHEGTENALNVLRLRATKSLATQR